MAPVPKLTPKQEKFAQSYLEKGIGSQAVREAGYNVSSDNSAEVIASQNLRKLQVMEHIEAKREAIAARNELTEDSIVAELQEARELAKVNNNASATGYTNLAQRSIFDERGLRVLQTGFNRGRLRILQRIPR